MDVLTDADLESMKAEEEQKSKLEALERQDQDVDSMFDAGMVNNILANAGFQMV